LARAPDYLLLKMDFCQPIPLSHRNKKKLQQCQRIKPNKEIEGEGAKNEGDES
jgi:hypothetical protein